jgi:hypothetical protein
MIFYSIIKLFSKAFHNKFATLYVVFLQNDRLSYKNLSKTIKQFFIYTVTLELWTSFYKKIKNNNNTYIFREKKKLSIYKIFCLFYKNKIIYYNELNVKRKLPKTIANFYNDIKIHNAPNKTLNLILFYYFNKIVLTNYPYFYWTNFNVYSNYGKFSENNKSRNNRSVLFFMYISFIKKFYKLTHKLSFIKTSLNSFRGIKNIFKNTLKNAKISIVPTKKILTNPNLQSKHAHNNQYERDHLKIYNKFFIFFKFKFYINNILYNNVLFTNKLIYKNT